MNKISKLLLLVEDEAVTAMAEEKQLREYGYDVVTALTGEEAAEIVRGRGDIDLILMDINLGPGMDGTETAATILKERDIPVVFLSSHADPAIVEKTEKITSYGYVVKNTGITVLDASIKMAFRLFEEKQNVKDHREQLESAYEELQSAHEELIQTNEQLEETQGEILKREEDLQESESRYRNLFETAKDAISIFKDGVCIDCNRATVELLGCSDKNEIIGGTPWDFSPPHQPDGRDSRGKALSLIESALKGEIQYFEWKQKKKDGTRFDVEVSLNAIELRGETYIQSITRDITERKVAQLRFETIFHMSLDMICIASLSDATFQQVNPAFTRVLGYSEEELLRRPFLDYIHPDDLKPTIDILEKELKKGKKVMRFENRYRTKEGDYRWLDWTSHPIADQDLTYAIAHDVTERKKAEKILIESEARLMSIFRAAPIGIGVVSNRIFTDVNDRFCEMTGYCRDELIGQNARMIYPSDEDYEYVGTEKYRQISEKGAGTVETRIKRKDGVIRHIIMSSTPMDPSDHSEGVTFTALDITERKLAEERIQSLLSEKNLLLKEVHHRIKNNMITMKNLLNLQADNLSDETAKRALLTAENRMTSMMLLYDRLYQSDVTDTISLREYLSSLVDEIMKTYPLYVSVTIDIADIHLPVHTAFPLGIIVNELISNAMKYAFAENGDNRLEVTASETGKKTTIIVHDNGKGFDGGDKAEGFGLDLVNALAKQIKGKFKIEKNRGTRCTLEITPLH